MEKAGTRGSHIEEGRESERVAIDPGPVLPEHGLPRLSIFPNVAVQPACGGGSGESVQMRCSTSPEEPEGSEDHERGKESSQAEKRHPEHLARR